ncbi:MAG: AMP-binding protein, partial [Lautropia mirabilis]
SLLLGGFELLMSRLTGSADVVVGVPAAGQMAAELPDIVGHCVNLLPVRGRIDTEVTAADWLAGVQRELLDAFDHQRFTFGTLLRHLALRRDPSRLPLVSVMFNLDQRLDPALTALPGFDTTIHPVARRFENFELFFNLTPLDTGLRIECQFSTALFDDASIQQWLQSYAALLTGIAQDPQRLVGHLPALDADQKAQLARWNRTEHEQGLGRTPVALLDRIGITQPRKVALADARHQLSYRALLDASHQLALRLQEYGVGPDSRVGLCLTRGVAMVVAQWAVWRTGAAYVPLDPHFPQDRLSYMAEDAGLALVMADAETVEVCQQFGWPAERTLTISADDLIRDLPASGEIEKRLDLSRPEAAAYVIYTSGSTGKPKGVAVPHRAAANLLLSMQRKPGIRASDRLLAVTTLSFDIALLELITPLIAGGTVHVADRDDTGDGHRLAERLQQWNITVMQATPGTWRLLLAADWQPPEGFRALVGGEPLPLDLARDLTALPVTLWNMYGPTET